MIYGIKTPHQTHGLLDRRVRFEKRIKESLPDQSSGTHSKRKALALALPVAERSEWQVTFIQLENFAGCFGSARNSTAVTFRGTNRLLVPKKS